MKSLVLFVVFVLLLLSFYFVLGFESKQKKWSKVKREWITTDKEWGKPIITIALIIEGILTTAVFVVSGSFMKVLNLSFRFAEADINPFWVLLSVLVATAIFIGIVVYLSKMAYLFGQKRKERHLSSGR